MTDGPWNEYAAAPKQDQPPGPWDDYAQPADGQGEAPASPAADGKQHYSLDIANLSASPSAGPPKPEDDAIGATIQRTIGKTLDAFGQGWQSVIGSQPLGSMSTEDAAKLDKIGVGPNSPNSLARAAWQAVIVPAAGALDIAVRAPSALYKGLQEGGMAAGVPRDIVSIPDAFMGSPHQFSMAKPVESAVPSPIKAISEDGIKRSDMAATGDPQIDAILKSPGTSEVINNPLVDRSHSVPYTAGGSVPLADPTIYIDHRFPKEIEAPRLSVQAPPVPDGAVRFYHGGDNPTSGGSRWLTPSADYARDYHGGPNTVHYVDLPKDHPTEVAARRWDEIDEKAGTAAVGTYGNVDAPEGVAQQLKPLNGTVKFDPAEPFTVHENVEQHTMELLTKGGMDDASAYRVAHYEFAEKAEGAWYRANDIDQTAAEKIYEPIMDRIQKGTDDKPPENLYEKPYPHDNEHMANGPDAIDHRPTADEIATARKILGGDPNAPRVTGGPADTVANSLPVARDLGLIGPERAPGEVPSMTAYHGSPHSFDAFHLDHIGTGEGAQAFGHGFYFAEHQGVADFYREKLSDARSPAETAQWAAQESGLSDPRAIASWLDEYLASADRGEHHFDISDANRKSLIEARAMLGRGVMPADGGALYQVRLHANQDHLLDLDKPLREQSATVRSAIGKPQFGSPDMDMSGEEFLRSEHEAGDPSEVSRALHEAGIPGIKYLDQGSRAAGEGTRNYVIFHHDDIEITHKNGVPVERPRTMASDTGVPKDATISEPAGERVATDKAGNIRMDLINKPEAVLDVMRKAAEENGGADAFSEARRGQIPLGQAEAIADAMGVDVKSLDLQGIGRKLQNDGMVRTYIKAMIQSAENVSNLAKQVALNDTPENLIAFQEARMRHSVIQEQVAGLTAEWGRTGNVFQEFSEAVKGAKKVGAAIKDETPDARTPTEKLDDFLAGKKGEGVESVENLRKMAKTIAGLDPAEVPKMLADARKPGFFDKLFWVRSNNLISGMVTHSKYLLVNGSWMLWNSLVVKQASALAGDVRSILSDKQIDRVYHGESAAEVAAMVRAFPTSIIAAARAIRDGVAPKLPGEVVKPGSGLAPGTGNPFESAFGHAAGEVVGAPGRGVTGIHTFYLTLGQRISLEGLGYRQAAKDGAKPWTMDFWDRQADHAANPSPEALTQSVKDAYYGAFMQPLGDFGKDLSRAIGKTPLRWLIPFRHVPGNLFKAGQEMLPLAFGSEELRGNLMGKNGDVARDTAIARLGLGSALGAYVVHSVLSDRVTGDGPNDPKARAEWLLTHQPNSVRVGDRWVSYARLGPIGDVIGIFANIGEIAPHVQDKEYGQAAAMGVVAGGRWLTDGAGMAGLADMFDLMREPDRRGVGIASNFVGGFKPFASALNQSAAAFDPNMRETRTFIDGLKIGIPGNAWGMGRESLPVKRDWLGNPVANPMQYSLLRQQQVNSDPLSAEMQRLDIQPTLPERMINKVKLNPQLYDEFQVLSGVPLSMQLHQMISAPGWENISPEIRKDIVQATIKNVRYGDGKTNKGIAGVMMMRHYSDLVQTPVETLVNRLTGQPPAP